MGVSRGFVAGKTAANAVRLIKSTSSPACRVGQIRVNPWWVSANSSNLKSHSVFQAVHGANADPPFFDVFSTPPYAIAISGLRMIHDLFVGRFNA